MAFLQIFVSQQLLFLFSKHLDTMSNVTDCDYGQTNLCAKAKAKAEARKVGDPWTDGVEHGPLVDKSQFDKVLEMVKSGQDQGANLQCGGTRAMDKGYFVKPTVFSGKL